MVGKPGSMKSFTALGHGRMRRHGRAMARLVCRPRTGAVPRRRKECAARQENGSARGRRQWATPHARRPPPAGSRCNAKNATQWDAFVALAAELKPALVVIDARPRVTGSRRRGTATPRWVSSSTASNGCAAAAGACVMIVHHIGRHGDTGRGATTVDGAVAAVIKVTKEDDRIALECQKNKDGIEWDRDIVLRAVPSRRQRRCLALDDGLMRHAAPALSLTRVGCRLVAGPRTRTRVRERARGLGRGVQNDTFHRSKLDLCKAVPGSEGGHGQCHPLQAHQRPRFRVSPQSHP